MIFGNKNGKSIQKYIICDLFSKPWPQKTLMAKVSLMVRKQEHPYSSNCHSLGNML